MKKRILIFFFLIGTTNMFSQKDSINVHQKYWEDQLYVNVTYNILNNQPDNIDANEVSYGIALGYIKDIPLNKNNTFALGIGIGYNYDYYTHSLVVNNSSNFTINDAATSNKMKLHNIEFPIQIRWRTSDAVVYNFWRIYTGVKLSYNFSNKFTYTIDEDYSFTNINNYNKLQTGLELSVGYGAFNLYTYYGLSPMYKDALYSSETIKTSVFKVGLIFYLL